MSKSFKFQSAHSFVVVPRLAASLPANLFGLTEDLCRDLVLQCYHWKPPKEASRRVFFFSRRVAASGASSMPTIIMRKFDGAIT